MSVVQKHSVDTFKRTLKKSPYGLRYIPAGTTRNSYKSVKNLYAIHYIRRVISLRCNPIRVTKY